MRLSQQEVRDIISAITEAQQELCTDTSSEGKFPEGTAYYNRLELLLNKFNKATIEVIPLKEQPATFLPNSKTYITNKAETKE